MCTNFNKVCDVLMYKHTKISENALKTVAIREFVCYNKRIKEFLGGKYYEIH